MQELEALSPVRPQYRASNVEGQIDFGDAVMLTQVLLQQIPQSFGGVDVHFSTGVLSLTMVDRLVLVA